MSDLGNKTPDLSKENSELREQLSVLEEKLQTVQAKAEAEKTKLLEQLQHSQKVEIVGHFAGGVANDFSSMLSVILGHAEIALSWIDSSHHLYENLQEIYKAAEHSANLTRQLLTFARKQNSVRKIQDLNAAVADLLKLLRRLIGEKVELVWQPCKTTCLVNVDPVQINQVLANLCVNASEAMAGSGRVSISIDTLMLDQNYLADQSDFSPGSYIVMTVSDTGCGMDSQTQSKVFEPFYTTKGDGSGLGLTVTQKIVKQNGGFITVVSEPGKGSAFKIHLPSYLDKNQQELSASNGSLIGHETILLVDDDIALLGMTTRMLQSMGYKVLSIDKPSEAISLVKTNPGKIDLLLTDLVMPEMNGRTLAREINELRPDIKSLFMSGYGEKIIARHGLMDSNVNFVAKPFTKKELYDSLLKVLGSQ